MHCIFNVKKTNQPLDIKYSCVICAGQSTHNPILMMRFVEETVSIVRPVQNKVKIKSNQSCLISGVLLTIFCSILVYELSRKIFNFIMLVCFAQSIKTETDSFLFAFVKGEKISGGIFVFTQSLKRWTKLLLKSTYKVQEACSKWFAVHLSKFEILQITRKKWNKRCRN